MAENKITELHVQHITYTLHTLSQYLTAKSYNTLDLIVVTAVLAFNSNIILFLSKKIIIS